MAQIIHQHVLAIFHSISPAHFILVYILVALTICWTAARNLNR